MDTNQKGERTTDDMDATDFSPSALEVQRLGAAFEFRFLPQAGATALLIVSSGTIAKCSLPFSS
jgi:hypothetical protein